MHYKINQEIRDWAHPLYCYIFYLAIRYINMTITQHAYIEVSSRHVTNLAKPELHLSRFTMDIAYEAKYNKHNEAGKLSSILLV